MIETAFFVETELFLLLNSFNTPLLDRVMRVISGWVFWVPFAAIVAGCIVYRYRLRALWVLGGIAGAVAVSNLTSLYMFKNVFQRVRPCNNPQIADLVHIVNGHCSEQFGFVSTHSANAFAFAVFFIGIFRSRSVGIVMFVWASAIAFSRVYLGVHYPADIIGGALLGAVCGYGFWKAVQRLLRAGDSPLTSTRLQQDRGN